jgi:hypothetical protein
MVICSPREFAQAVGAHTLDDCAFDGEPLLRAAASVADSGLLVVGEPHGVRETPGVLHALALAVGARAVAFEWSHEEMDESVQIFLRSGSLDFERLWSLPASSEFFCGDGRITVGHFALLEQLREEGCLDQVIVFDRLDPDPLRDDWRQRDREMAERLLAEWNDQVPLLVLTGASHARLEAEDGKTMTMCLADEQPGVVAAMLDYAKGSCWSRGELHDVSGPMPDAPIILRMPEATPADVPGTISC